MTIVEGVGPPLTIYATNQLIDIVIEINGQGVEGFLRVVPWIILLTSAFIFSQEIWGQFREPLFMLLKQKVQHVLDRKVLEKSSKLPILFLRIMILLIF